MNYYEHNAKDTSYEIIEASFEPDYLVESRELTDREIQDFREQFLSFASRVQFSELN